MPAVAIVSLRVKQEIRAKLHLAPPLVVKASSWQTFGCNYKFGESKYSAHAITDLVLLSHTSGFLENATALSGVL